MRLKHFLAGAVGQTMPSENCRRGGEGEGERACESERVSVCVRDRGWERELRNSVNRERGSEQ